MRRFLSNAVLAVLVVAGMACSDDPNPSKDAGGGSDAGLDTNLDSTTDDTGEKNDVAPDIDREPIDVNTNWDFGVPDGDGSSQTFSLDRVVPPTGPVEGGNRVSIVGKGLNEHVRVFFGGRELDVSFSGGALVGHAPAAPNPGKVTVKAIDEETQNSESIEDGYEYVAGVEVDSITPARVPTEGGVLVEIRGSGFSKPTAVSFDGKSALRVNRIDRELIRAIVPPGSVGPADVRVTTSAESEVVEDGIEYFDELEVKSIEPASGPTAGGQRVTMVVAGLAKNATVSFGKAAGTVKNVDVRKGTLEVETPAHTAGLVDVSVQSGGDATIAEDAYFYTDKTSPVIAAVEPDHGPAAGGTEVRIIGRGFGASNIAFEFGGKTATVVEAKKTFARVKTPAGKVGKVDVVAKSAGTELARLNNGFEYRANLSIDKISPASGTMKGGTTVDIEGTGFTGTDKVTFGGLPAQFTVKSNKRLEVVTPPHSAGKVDVVVERDDIEAVEKGGFTYTTKLAVWGFSPARGAIAGGTYVEVRGRGFIGRVDVQFDGASASNIRRIDRNNIYLHTPAHEPGEATVKVKAEGKTATGPYPYQYFNPAGRYGGASGGSVRGAVNVTVLAQGAGPIPNAFVMLSTRADTPYTGQTDQNGQLTLSGPDVLGPQTVTATAKGYSSTTVKSVDAENITVFLTKMNAMGGGGGGGGGPPVAKIKGKVSAPVKMSNPDEQKTYDMAVVRTTKKNISDRQMEPGPNSVVVGGGKYEIKSRIGDLAVIALCGTYHEQTDEFEPQYMGVKRYLNVSDGDTKTVDLKCDIPLDQSIDVKIQNPIFAPGGPDTNIAQVYWDFGFDGVFESPTVGRGMSKLLTVENQPALEGQISDVTLSVVGGSFTGTSSPSSQTQVHDIKTTKTPVVLPPLVDVPEPVSPKPGGTMQNREIRFQTAGPYYADLYSIYLLNQKGQPFWQYLMSGKSRTVEIPNFPDLSYLPPAQRPEPVSHGQAFILILGIDARNAQFDSFSYQDLSFSRWRGYSVTRWGFTIP